MDEPEPAVRVVGVCDVSHFQYNVRGANDAKNKPLRPRWK